MKAFLVSYDLHSSNDAANSAFLDAAANHSLSYLFIENGIVQRLPETTIWGVFDSAAYCNASILDAVVDAELDIGDTITVTRIAITIFEDAFVDSDKVTVYIPALRGSNLLETCLNHQLNDPEF